MNRTLAILFLLLFSLSACNEPQNNSTTTTPPPAKTEAPNPTSLASNKPFLPSLTMEDLQIMWNTCNQMDYIFYELPISSSLDDNASAQVHLRHISDTPTSIKEKNRCGKAIGRIFYKADGEDLINAEVFFGGGCAFFVFHKDGKAQYSNLLTPAGVSHFNQLMSIKANNQNPG